MAWLLKFGDEDSHKKEVAALIIGETETHDNGKDKNQDKRYDHNFLYRPSPLKVGWRWEKKEIIKIHV